MKVLVIGAAGMIGRKLVERLSREGELGGKKIESLSAVDIVAPSPGPAPFPIETAAYDIAAAYVAPRLVASRPDAIFVLASVVSGEAEADFEKGYCDQSRRHALPFRGDPPRAAACGRKLSSRASFSLPP